MKPSSRAAALTGLVLSLGLLACFWVNGTTLAGGNLTVSGLSPANQLHRMLARKPMDAFVRLHTEEMIKVVDEYSEQELTAVEAVIDGRKSEGIALLEALEAKHPGHYSIASNLGTAYELNGDNRKALEWISEGIRRNPESHEGTEWLHELILRTKLMLEQNPAWLQSHRVLELDEAQLSSAAYRLQAGGRSLSVNDLRTALLHQLTERMLFVKPKDPIVADLLYTYGVLEAHASVVESALQLMALSKEYGFAVPALMEEQVRRFGWPVLRNTIYLYSLWIGVGVFFVGGLYYCHRRKWFLSVF